MIGLRRFVIKELLCHLKVEFDTIDKIFGADSRSELQSSIDALQPMQEDGLVICNANGISITDRGRLLVRNVCMAFDRYLQQHEQQRFSKAI